MGYYKKVQRIKKKIGLSIKNKHLLFLHKDSIEVFDTAMKELCGPVDRSNSSLDTSLIKSDDNSHLKYKSLLEALKIK